VYDLPLSLRCSESRNPTPPTFARADTARIRGIGRLWRHLRALERFSREGMLPTLHHPQRLDSQRPKGKSSDTVAAREREFIASLHAQNENLVLRVP
jgi:hypothetical protein